MRVCGLEAAMHANVIKQWFAFIRLHERPQAMLQQSVKIYSAAWPHGRMAACRFLPQIPPEISEKFHDEVPAQAQMHLAASQAS